ncbi:MAG: FMN-binding protein [Acidobacteriota bacterium]
MTGSLLLTLMAQGPPATARVLMTRQEALELAFPGARMERRNAYLDEDQLKRVKSLCGRGVMVNRALVPYYLAWREGRLLGAAYFDTHQVRTQMETVMITVAPSGKIGRIEILSFNEPADYLARAAWLAQFEGRGLDAELSLKRAIHPMTGASLSARAITRAARRILAYHQVIGPGAAAGKESPPPSHGRKPARPQGEKP